MEASAENLAHMRGLLVDSMSADNVARRKAETTITHVETQAGFSQVLLALVQQLSTANATAEERAIRKSCALLFKNLVKRRWQPDEALAPSDSEYCASDSSSDGASDSEYSSEDGASDSEYSEDDEADFA